MMDGLPENAVAIILPIKLITSKLCMSVCCIQAGQEPFSDREQDGGGTVLTSRRTIAMELAAIFNDFRAHEVPGIPAIRDLLLWKPSQL
jgi:hypothetical protein